MSRPSVFQEARENWGRDEATADVKSFFDDMADGASRDEALASLRRRRDHAATFIDVPEQWEAYCDVLLRAVPDIDGGQP